MPKIKKTVKSKNCKKDEWQDLADGLLAYAEEEMAEQQLWADTVSRREIKSKLSQMNTASVQISRIRGIPAASEAAEKLYSIRFAIPHQPINGKRSA